MIIIREKKTEVRHEHTPIGELPVSMVRPHADKERFSEFITADDLVGSSGYRQISVSTKYFMQSGVFIAQGGYITRGRGYWTMDDINLCRAGSRDDPMFSIPVKHIKKMDMSSRSIRFELVDGTTIIWSKL